MTDVECFNLGTEMKINSNCNSISYIAKLVRFPLSVFRFPFAVSHFSLPNRLTQLVNVVYGKIWTIISALQMATKAETATKIRKREEKKKRENKTDAEKNSIIWATCVHAWILIGNSIFNKCTQIDFSTERERGRGSKRVEGIERKREGDRCRYIFQSHTHLQEY